MKALIYSLSGLLVSSLTLATTSHAQTLSPAATVPSPVQIEVKYEGTMPWAPGPVFPGVIGPNLGSPVVIKNRLYFIDQNHSIFELRKNKQQPYVEIFNADTDAPDGLALDNRQSVLNISEGSKNNEMFVMFTSGNAPTTGIPLHDLPAPTPWPSCDRDNATTLPDIYRVGTVGTYCPAFGFYGTTRTEWQTLYRYKHVGHELRDPEPIVAFAAQSGPTHNGGGMLTLPNGKVLFASADQKVFGQGGDQADQSTGSHVSSLIIIDPDTGDIEIAAVGGRNVQHLQYSPDGQYILFADIGGITAEEINAISVADLMDTSSVESFGWGLASDGNRREGTFYVDEGVALILGSEPPALSVAPSPELGFRQPLAQFGRPTTSPAFFQASSGPAMSDTSLSTFTMLFGDLASGIVLAIDANLNDVATTVYQPVLVDENGVAFPNNTLHDLIGGVRADPRFFIFPNGDAGVLLEATGGYYRLTEL